MAATGRRRGVTQIYKILSPLGVDWWKYRKRTHNNSNMRDSEWSQAPLEVPPKPNVSRYYDDPADWEILPWKGSPDKKPANMVRLVNKKDGRMTEWLPTGHPDVLRVAPEHFNKEQHRMMFSDDSPFLEAARQRKADAAAKKKAKAKEEFLENPADKYMPGAGSSAWLDDSASHRKARADREAAKAKRLEAAREGGEALKNLSADEVVEMTLDELEQLDGVELTADDKAAIESWRLSLKESAAEKAEKEEAARARAVEAAAAVKEIATLKALDAVEAKELPQSRKGKMAAEEFAEELRIFTADKTPEQLFAIGTFRSKNGIFTVRFSPKRDDKGGWDDLPTGTLTSEQMEAMKNTTGPKSQAEFNELYHSGGQRLQNLFANHLKMAESYGGDGKRILTVELPAWATKYMPTEMKRFYEQQIMDCSGGSSGKVEEWA